MLLEQNLSIWGRHACAIFHCTCCLPEFFFMCFLTIILLLMLKCVGITYLLTFPTSCIIVIMFCFLLFCFIVMRMSYHPIQYPFECHVIRPVPSRLFPVAGFGRRSKAEVAEREQQARAGDTGARLLLW